MVVARVEASTRPPPSIGSGMRLGHVAAFAAALVGALVVATLAVQNHQAVALLSSPVDPRIVGYEKRLKEIENGLMGLSGRRALEMAQRASVLQAKIETLRRGGAALAGRMQLLARHDFRVQRPQWRGREGAEERGSFAARSHIAFTPTVPLDMTGRAKADGSTAASILAENLERFRREHHLAPSAVRRNLPVGSVAPPGYIAVRAIEPGETIPKGAKVVPRQALARIATANGGVWEEVSLKGARHHSDSLMMLESSERAAEGDLVDEGNFTMGGGDMEVVSRGRNVTEEPPPPLVGETNMTMSELKEYATKLENDAVQIMRSVTSARDLALSSMAVGEGMVKKGWMKHLAAADMFEQARDESANATALLAEYRSGVAEARSVQSEQVSKELAEIGETLTSEAAKRREIADRWASFEDALKWENGTLVDTSDNPADGDLDVPAAGGGEEEPIEVTTSAPVA